ncbi:putative FAD-dependent oxidoreductase [Lipomyces arxii]|uniref:putative FAD-dependent oxidoreductase n=1 Tax=Lipomyces arxii TaxID=56418 RepID=UPI0034CDDA1C
MVDFSHLVVGAGVVGLSVAARLSRAGASVLLVDRHGAIGTEISARNSEVIHAGLYYPPDSLKTQLCIKGKHMLYEIAEKAGIPYRNCGKWIVAQNDSEHEYLESMHLKARELKVPTEFLSLEQGRMLEPAVRARSAILHSPTTGIVSSHSLMTYLLGQHEEHGGDLALNTAVSAMEFDQSRGLYSVLFRSEDGEMELKFENVVNSAGLSAPLISNMLLPTYRHLTPHYAKGSYYSYGLSKPKTNRLIYPCPAGHAGLGSHLTLDLGGRIRFGPNVEWVSSPDDLTPDNTQLEDVYAAVQQYLPTVEKSSLKPDYSGIRPKLAGPDHKQFIDFIIREEEGFPGFVNLLGIESPGLTSSLAIGEEVFELYKS